MSIFYILQLLLSTSEVDNLDCNYLILIYLQYSPIPINHCSLSLTHCLSITPCQPHIFKSVKNIITKRSNIITPSLSLNFNIFRPVKTLTLSLSSQQSHHRFHQSGEDPPKDHTLKPTQPPNNALLVVVELNETKMAHCKHRFQWLTFTLTKATPNRG